MKPKFYMEKLAMINASMNGNCMHMKISLILITDG